MTRSSHASQSILVVENESDIRALIAFVLTRAGHTPSCVGTVAEALAEIAVHDFDVAVIDLCLPDGRGDEIVRVLRETTPLTRIVITSAFAHSSLALQEAAATGDQFLNKPFGSAELLAAIAADPPPPAAPVC